MAIFADVGEVCISEDSGPIFAEGVAEASCRACHYCDGVDLHAPFADLDKAGHFVCLCAWPPYARVLHAVDGLPPRGDAKSRLLILISR